MLENIRPKAENICSTNTYINDSSLLYNLVSTSQSIQNRQWNRDLLKKSLYHHYVVRLDNSSKDIKCNNSKKAMIPENINIIHELQQLKYISKPRDFQDYEDNISKAHKESVNSKDYGSISESPTFKLKQVVEEIVSVIKASDRELHFRSSNDVNIEGSQTGDIVGTVESVTRNESEIKTYLMLEKVAYDIVNDVISISERKVQLHFETDDVQLQNTFSTYVEEFRGFSGWPTINEFTVNLGTDKLSDYMSTWFYEENWLYDLTFLMAQSDDCSDFYFYEAKWSIPTKEYPIPQATASVYFRIEVSRVLPKKSLVSVFYQFEGNGYEHVPFQHTFQEEWLFNIVESKLKLFKSVTF